MSDSDSYIDDLFDILDASAPYTPWMVQFTQLMMLHYATNLPIGVQQLAIRLGPEIYHTGEFNPKEACLEAIKRAKKMPAQDKMESIKSLRQAEESLRKKSPWLFKGEDSGESA
jgi:hypothetical protein